MSSIAAKSQPLSKSMKWSRVVPLIALSTASVLVPFVAALIVHYILKGETQTELISVGILTGLGVGQLTALRRRTLLAFVVGPAIGFAGGVLDLKAFVWFYVAAEWPMWMAALLPLWGLALGAWVSATHMSWRAKLRTILLIAGADFASRLLWWFAASSGAITELGLGQEKLALLEAVTYVPACLLIVVLTKPFRSSAHA